MKGQTNAFAKHRSVQLRRKQTDAEQKLWKALKHDQPGARFRRQLAFDRYILDFVCVALRLVVEVDGSQHLEDPDDVERTSFLEQAGFRVLRFWNHEVLLEIDVVVEVIFRELEMRRALLNPSPPWPSP